MAGEWLIQQGSNTRTLSEERLRKKLRKGDLSGTELARPAAATEWRPLHAWDVFREEVAHTGDPAAAARWRHLTALGWHAASFAAVMLMLNFPPWGVFWGLAVVLHAVRALPTLRAALARPPADALPDAAPPAAAASPAADAFEERLAALLAALEQPAGADAAALADSARALHQRRLALSAALAEADPAALKADLAALQGDESPAAAREADALAGRLAALRQAMQAHERLAAQERELLHHLEGLRLARLGEGAPDLGDQLGSLRQRLQAEAEVNAHLAAARRAAHQGARQA